MSRGMFMFVRVFSSLFCFYWTCKIWPLECSYLLRLPHSSTFSFSHPSSVLTQASPGERQSFDMNGIFSPSNKSDYVSMLMRPFNGLKILLDVSFGFCLVLILLWAPFCSVLWFILFRPFDWKSIRLWIYFTKVGFGIWNEKSSFI